MTVDAYFDTFNAFDTCRRLVTLWTCPHFWHNQLRLNLQRMGE
jgi:hypothetical protein